MRTPPPPRKPGPAASIVLFAMLTTAGALSPQAAKAQIEDTPRFEGEVEVTEVLLDVVVTDRSGHLVAGLGPTDFLVEENGREMEVTGADFYTTRYGREGGARDSQEIPASRYFVFFFHDARFSANRFNRLLRQQLDAAQQSRRWIEEEMGPSDWVAIAGYTMKLNVFQDFTQDREALLQAITDAARGINPEKGRWTQKPTPAGAPSLLRQLPSGKELRRQSRRIYSGLTLLSEAMGHIVGRKALLYFGTGFGALDSTSGGAVPDRRYYPELEQALNDNNIAVYTIDLTVQGARHSQSSFLNTLALDTGGNYYRNFVSFFSPLEAIGNQTIGYYLLSYQSAHPQGESGYQKVRVRSRVPKLVTRAPRGYRYGDGSERRE